MDREYSYPRLIKLALAAPGGIDQQLGSIHALVAEWNAEHVDTEQTVFKVYHWEKDVVHRVEGTRGPQDVIDEVLDQCHGMIAAFPADYVGTPFLEYAGMTEYEMERMLSAGESVYMLVLDYPKELNDVDTSELARFQEFKARWRKRGLVKDVNNDRQLEKAINAILKDLTRRARDQRNEIVVGEGTVAKFRFRAFRAGELVNIRVVNDSEVDVSEFLLENVLIDQRPAVVLPSSIGIRLNAGGEMIYYVQAANPEGTVLSGVAKWRSPRGVERVGFQLSNPPIPSSHE